MTERIIQVTDVFSEASTKQYLRILLLCAKTVAKSNQVRAALAGFDRFMIGQCDLQQAIKNPHVEQSASSINLTHPLAATFLQLAIKQVEQLGDIAQSLLPWFSALLEKEQSVNLEYLQVKTVTRNISSITLACAKQLAQQAEIRAVQIQVPMSIAVMDATCNMVLHQRMEDALQTSVKVALNKAYTAVSFKIPSYQLAPLIQPGAELYGIQESDPQLVGFGGGFPIWIEGKLIGGLGVAGGTVEQDMEVARFALKQVLAIEI